MCVCPIVHTCVNVLSTQVFEVADVLSQWEKDVAKLRVEYEQLLFFSIPKLLHLYQLITASEPSVTKIVQEVSFLFQNKPKVRRKLKEIVKVCSIYFSKICC